jgi:hypothetical protein
LSFPCHFHSRRSFCCLLLARHISLGETSR